MDFGSNYQIPYEEDDRNNEGREEIVLGGKTWTRMGRKPTNKNENKWKKNRTMKTTYLSKPNG